MQSSRRPSQRCNSRTGIWSEDEHDRFLDAIREFPRGPWFVIAQAVGTRSVRQVQTHTQKYYEKIMRHIRGLRKGRKTWARVEHRIDDDILEFCTFMKKSSKTRTGTPPSTPRASWQRSTKTGSISPSSSPLRRCEHKFEASSPMKDIPELSVSSTEVVDQQLLPFEEAIDFLIEVVDIS